MENVYIYKEILLNENSDNQIVEDVAKNVLVKNINAFNELAKWLMNKRS